MYTVRVKLAGNNRIYSCATIADAEALLQVFAKAGIEADFT